MCSFQNVTKLALLVLSLTFFTSASSKGLSKDRTLTKVVKQLEAMLKASQAEGEEERVAYAKFKCSCDDNKEEKEKSIEAAEKQIDLLSAKIEDLQGENGELSEECAELKADMAENKAAQDEATAIRDKAHAAFVAEEKDLKGAIAQLTEAIETLAQVSADQTESEGAADHTKFMAGYGGPRGLESSLLRLKSTVTKALNSAAALSMDPHKQQVVAAFVQAPFTGTYTSQSVEIMGILKNMKDTFEANLAEAIAKEAAELKAYNALMKTLTAEYEEMSKSYDKKQTELGNNDDALSSSREMLTAAKVAKKEAEDFLAEMIPLCADKAEQYKKRNQLRVNEEMAISEAISILNSDDAFATFGKTDAATTAKLPEAASFVQFASISRHSSERAVKDEVVKQLQKVKRSARLAKLAAQIQASENPFDAVLKEIAAMITVIDEESKTDKEKLDFCNSEREAKDKDVKDLEDSIVTLDKTIGDLDDKINNPETGLLVQIESDKDDLKTNRETQAAETAAFEKLTTEFKADVENLQEAQAILKKAIGVLTTYYSGLSETVKEHEAAEAKKDEPSEGMPSGYDPNMKGQSTSGNKAIDMLNFILTSTEEEETEAKKDYKESKEGYEEQMESLKTAETNLLNNIAQLEGTLAVTKETLMLRKKDREATQADLDATKAYLAKIKAGCDFITENFKLRTDNRAEEKEQLMKAAELIKGTPAYKAAMTEAHIQSFGDCESKCEHNQEGTLACKACMADVTEVGYCAGHPDQEGCKSS